jgi:hypothetical protein
MPDSYTVQDIYNAINAASLGIGKPSDAAAPAGETGTVNGKLRQISTDIDSLKAALGAVNDTESAAGDIGTISAKLRLLTDELNTIRAGMGLSTDLSNTAGAEGTIHAKLRRMSVDIAAIITFLSTQGITIKHTALDEFTFQSAAQVPDKGQRLMLNGMASVIISATGTATSFSASIKATGPQSVEDYAMGTRYESDGRITMTPIITDKNRIYLVGGLTGFTDVFVELTAIAGGNITIKGKAVS